MKKVLITLAIISSISYAKDVSVFGAGNLESNTPYGMTNAEKASYKNSKELKQLAYKINSIENSNEELKQQLEGFKSVFNSDSKNLNDTKNNLQQLLTSFEEINSRITQNEKDLQSLKEKLDNFISLETKNNELLEDSNRKLNNIITKINRNYVSKKEFDELVNFVNKKGTTKKVAPVKKNNADNNFGFKTNSALYTYAVKLHKKFYLTKSMPMFDKLIKDNYKKASSSYYLADILHYKKRYKDAIHYYKQSMMLNDQASYIPDLLYNSAHSFEKLKDFENARNFYQTLVDAYGDTSEAKKASKRLEKIK